MPKSDSFTSPFHDSRMLGGLTSRWTMRERAVVVVAQVVDVRQRVRDLGGHVQRDAFGHRDDVGRRARHRAEGVQALDVFHRHELAAVDQAVVEDRHDAAVMHPASDARLLEEHAAALAVARVLRQQALDRHAAFEPAVPGGDGFHHLRHPTARDGSDETITLGRVHAGRC